MKLVQRESLTDRCEQPSRSVAPTAAVSTHRRTTGRASICELHRRSLPWIALVYLVGGMLFGYAVSWPELALRPVPHAAFARELSQACIAVATFGSLLTSLAAWVARRGRHHAETGERGELEEGLRRAFGASPAEAERVANLLDEVDVGQPGRLSMEARSAICLLAFGRSPNLLMRDVGRLREPQAPVPERLRIAAIRVVPACGGMLELRYLAFLAHGTGGQSSSAAIRNAAGRAHAALRARLFPPMPRLLRPAEPRVAGRTLVRPASGGTEAPQHLLVSPSEKDASE